MVRLSDVMLRFGYTVDWDNDTRTAHVLADGVTVSSVTIDENSYRYRNGRPRELEVAPMIHNGLTYVPLSFFSEVVGIPATVTPEGIVISRYIFNAGASAGSVYHNFLSE